MSEYVGKDLNGKILNLIGIDQNVRKNVPIFLLVTDENGFPNTALLSPYQMIAKDSRSILLSVYSDSRTGILLSSVGKITIILQTLPGLTYIKCKTTQLNESIEIDGTNRKVFHAIPEEVLIDKSDISPFTSELIFDSSNIIGMYSSEFESLKKIATAHNEL